MKCSTPCGMTPERDHLAALRRCASTGCNGTPSGRNLYCDVCRRERTLASKRDSQRARRAEGRHCDRCGLTLLGWIEHASADECLAAMRGKYEGLKRTNKLLARVADAKAEQLERWRLRARVAEAKVKDLEAGSVPIARLERLAKRLAAIEKQVRAA